MLATGDLASYRYRNDPHEIYTTIVLSWDFEDASTRRYGIDYLSENEGWD
jgi:hypothetical protein